MISSAISSWVKIGPWTKRKERRPVSSWSMHFGAENIGGHQVGRELDAAGIEAEHGAERRDELGLGKTGNADEQRMATGQHGKQRLFDDAFLAEDHLADFLADHGNLAQRLFGRGDDCLFVHCAFRGLHHTHRRLQWSGPVQRRIAKSAVSIVFFNLGSARAADKPTALHYLVRRMQIPGKFAATITTKRDGTMAEAKIHETGRCGGAGCADLARCRPDRGRGKAVCRR